MIVLFTIKVRILLKRIYDMSNLIKGRRGVQSEAGQDVMSKRVLHIPRCVESMSARFIGNCHIREGVRYHQMITHQKH